MKNKILLTLGLIGSLVTGIGCAPNLRAVKDTKFNSEFYKQSDRFYVNNGDANKKNGHRMHYAVEATRKEGEKGIENLLNQDLEEYWLYTKGTLQDGKDVERWYEVGEKSTKEIVENIHNPEKIIADFKNIDEISGYHIHPIDKNNQNLYGVSGSDSPSIEDIISFLRTRNIVNHFSKSKIRSLDFRIITPVGTYIITPPAELTDSEADSLSNYQEKRFRYQIGEVALEDLINVLRNAGLSVELKENTISKALNKSEKGN